MRAVALGIALPLVLAGAAPALVVDSFETGVFQLASNGTEQELLQSALDPAVVASGSRRIVLLGATSAIASLAFTAGDDGVVVSTQDGASLVLGYAVSGVDGLDWTDGGSADRLRIAVTGVSHPLAISVTVTTIAPVEMQNVLIDAPSDGVYEIPFVTFGFAAEDAFENVFSLTFLATQTLTASGASSFTVSDLRTVPEPDGAATFAIATLTLLASSRPKEIRRGI